MPADARAVLTVVFDRCPWAVAVFDRSERFVYVNPAMAALNGRSVEAHVGLHPTDLAGEAAESWLATARRVARTKQSLAPHRYDAPLPGGHSFEVSYFPVGDDLLGAIVREITPSVRAEERFRAAAAVTAAVAAAHDRDELVGALGAAMAGITTAAAVLAPGQHVTDVLTDPLASGEEEAEVPLAADGPEGAWRLAVRWREAAHDRAAMEELLEGVATVAAVGMSRMAALEQAGGDLFRRALDAMHDDVVVTEAVRDAEGALVDFVLVHANERARDAYGRRISELVGRRIGEAYPSLRASGMFDELVEVVETRRPVLSPRHRYGDPDAGIDSWWDVRAVPFGDGYLLAARDVTEAVLAEHAAEERRVAERSERLALGLLQQLGLPAALPVPAGLDVAARYRPADTDLPVGGDWYDVVELADGGCCLVVGDVAGHGVGAVDAMVRLRHALTAYALDDESPDRVLARARRVARREALFATCLLARFDPVRRHLVYARAGHLPAVLVRDGAAVLLDAAVTPPLSASTWAGGERSAHVPVRPGDVLVLYTDGLIERRGEPLDTSLAGLAAFVSGVRGSASEVCEAVVAWAGRSGTPFTDDFCLVVAAVS